MHLLIYMGGSQQPDVERVQSVFISRPPRYNAFLNIRLRTLKNKCVNSTLGQKQCFKIKTKSSTIQITHLKTYFKS